MLPTAPVPGNAKGSVSHGDDLDGADDGGDGHDTN